MHQSRIIVRLLGRRLIYDGIGRNQDRHLGQFRQLDQQPNQQQKWRSAARVFATPIPVCGPGRSIGGTVNPATRTRLRIATGSETRHGPGDNPYSIKARQQPGQRLGGAHGSLRRQGSVGGKELLYPSRATRGRTCQASRFSPFAGGRCTDDHRDARRPRSRANSRDNLPERFHQRPESCSVILATE